MNALLDGDLLDHEPVGHRVVRHLQSVGVPQVYLMLAGAYLVVGVLDAYAHLLEREHGLAPQVACDVQRCEVEIPAAVERYRRGVRTREGIELELRAHVEGVAELLGFLQVAPQNEARVALMRAPVGLEDVTEHPGHRAVAAGAPREQCERRGVGLGDHVALVDPRETLDAGAVEPHPCLQRLLELLPRDGEALQEAEDVGEP
jgi:hypothetical protein